MMNFKLNEAIEILERTPRVVDALLAGLDDAWTASAGDQEDWRPYDVVGHLIHAERTDWIPRAKIILARGSNATFEPFDRLAQFESSDGRSLELLIKEFADARSGSLSVLRSWQLTPEQLELKGTHPELGEVSLNQLLATWVVHDLTHLRQIARSLAIRYTEDVGPWKQYLSILN